MAAKHFEGSSRNLAGIHSCVFDIKLVKRLGESRLCLYLPSRNLSIGLKSDTSHRNLCVAHNNGPFPEARCACAGFDCDAIRKRPRSPRCASSVCLLALRWFMHQEVAEYGRLKSPLSSIRRFIARRCKVEGKSSCMHHPSHVRSLGGNSIGYLSA